MLLEKKRRSVIKAVSWRVLATLTTMGIVYFLTGDISISMAAGGVDVILKMLLYYFHERSWNRIRWGKKLCRPFVLWFTGLPGSGKSTLAGEVIDRLINMGLKCEKLDGDVVRGIFPKTGFSKEERNMHIKRTGFLASMLERNGIPVIAAFVSPYRDARDFVRGMTENFIEIYLSTSIEECERRDPKGLYKRARAGEVKQFTGIDDPYEKPVNSELKIDTAGRSPKSCTDEIVAYLKRRKYIY